MNSGEVVAEEGELPGEHAAAERRVVATREDATRDLSPLVAAKAGEQFFRGDGKGVVPAAGE